MKKYLYIFKSELMSNLQYVVNILTGFIGYFIMLFIFLNLWKYIYSDPNEIINGYSFSQMLWYVILTEILWGTINGRKFCKQISNDVKDGNIAYNINKPYNYIWYCVFNHLGECIIRFAIYFILGLLTGFIFLNCFPNLNILSILVVILSCILSTIISTLFITFIGLFSFIIEDSHPFYWLYSKLILILGTIFPIEFFPKIVQPIIRYSPVYVISYGPAKLFVNYNNKEAIMVLLFQIIYIFIGYVLCKLIYNKGVKNLNVNGG